MIIFILFLTGCNGSQSNIDAEAQAISWINSRAIEVFEPFSANFSVNITEIFYVLKSSESKEGFCVEIASKERNPPKYQNQYSSVTTLPIFINQNNEVKEFSTKCFEDAYPDNRGKILKIMSTEKEETKHSTIQFFLIREVGNAISKSKLKQFGYAPNYEINPAAEYFTDALLFEILNDQKFNNTMKSYVTAEFEISGEEMMKQYIDSVK